MKFKKPKPLSYSDWSWQENIRRDQDYLWEAVKRMSRKDLVAEVEQNNPRGPLASSPSGWSDYHPGPTTGNPSRPIRSTGCSRACHPTPSRCWRSKKCCGRRTAAWLSRSSPNSPPTRGGEHR